MFVEYMLLREFIDKILFKVSKTTFIIYLHLLHFKLRFSSSFNCPSSVMVSLFHYQLIAHNDIYFTYVPLYEVHLKDIQ